MDWMDIFDERLKAAEALMRETNKAGVLVIQQPLICNSITVFFPRIRESISNILVFAELSESKDLEALIKKADSRFSAIVIDCDWKHATSREFLDTARKLDWSAGRFFFSDYAVWSVAAAEFIQMTLTTQRAGDAAGCLWLKGNDTLGRLLGLQLLQLGFDLAVDGDSPLLAWREFYPEQLRTVAENSQRIQALIGASAVTPCCTPAEVAALPEATVAYDVGIGCFPEATVAAMREKQFTLFRHDNRAGIATLVTRLLETNDLIHHVMGEARLGTVDVVAGGILGGNGSVVVDNISDPEYIIGVADGAGQLKVQPYSDKDQKSIAFVQQFLAKCPGEAPEA